MKISEEDAMRMAFERECAEHYRRHVRSVWSKSESELATEALIEWLKARFGIKEAGR